MSLVPAICPQCGGAIEVDDSHEAGVCKFCNTPFITEKVINNYSINIQNAVINMPNVKLENLKKLGDEKLKTPHYPFEIDEYQKAQEYFLKVLEFEDSKEYKLKADLCDNAIHVDRVSLSYTVKIIRNVIDFIKEDEKAETFTEQRITVYADLIRVMTDAIEAISMYYYKRFSSGSLNASVYASCLINLAKEKVVCANFLKRYNNNPKIIKVAVSLCKTGESDLSSCLPTYVPNLSHDTYAEIPPVAKDIERIGSVFDSSYKVREDICNISESSESNNTSGNNNGGCYVATAVYGSYDCPQVWTLRRYRDSTLTGTWYGRAFIRFYYAISPTLVKWFGDTNWFKKTWKQALDKMVDNLNKNGVENTPYEDKKW